MSKEKLKLIKKLEKKRLLAQRNGKTNEEAEIVNELGELHTSIGEYEEALKLHKEELALCSAGRDVIGQAIANRKIGEAYANLSKFDKAIKHQKLHLSLAKTGRSVIEEQRAWMTLGRTYLMEAEEMELSQDKTNSLPTLLKAKESFQKSLDCVRILKDRTKLSSKEIAEMTIRSYINLGLCNHNLSEHEENNFDKSKLEEKSKELFSRAITTGKKYSFYADLFRAYVLNTVIDRRRGNLSSAKQNAHKACMCADSAKNKEWQKEAYTTAGDIAMHLGENNSCKVYFKKAYTTCTSSDDDKTSTREKLLNSIKICKLEDEIKNCKNNLKVFQILEAMGDIYSNNQCFDRAIKQYKKQESMFGSLPELTNLQKASVLFSLALTYLDIKNYDSALHYFKKELEYQTENKELSKTWSQIALCKEKDLVDYEDTLNCYNTAMEYAEKSEDAHLQLKVLLLLKDYYQSNAKFDDLSTVKSKIYSLEQKYGIESSQTTNSENSCEIVNQEVDDLLNDSQELLDEELAVVEDAESHQRTKYTGGGNWKNNEKGESPLHRACISGNSKTVQVLLKQRHPVNIYDHCGWTPLHEACNHGHYEIAEMLINFGANINDPGGSGCGGITPLHDAAYQELLGLCLLLIKRGAKFDLKDKTGRTAIGIIESLYQDYQQDFDMDLLEYYKEIKKYISNLDPEKYDMVPTTSAEAELNLNTSILCDNLPNLSPEKSTTSSWSQPAMVPSTPALYVDNDLPDLNDDISEVLSDKENAVDDYRSALAVVGSSSARAKQFKKTVRLGRKRSIDLTTSQNPLTVDDDVWMVDDDNSNDSQPSKRFCTNSKKLKQGKLPFSQSVKRNKSKPIRRTNSIKKVSSTKIHEFFVPSPGSSKHDSEVDISDTESITNNLTVQSTNNNLTFNSTTSTRVYNTDEVPLKRTFRIRVKMNDKMSLIAVPDATTKTISWLCERVSSLYKETNGIKPDLNLYTRTSSQENEQCLLSNDDVISDTLQSNDVVVAVIKSWNQCPLPKQYKQLADEFDCMVLGPVIQSCDQCTKTGVLELSKKMYTVKRHLKPLLLSLGRSEITAINLSGNILMDDGLAMMCESFRKYKSLSSSTNLLSTINLSCCSLTSVGVKSLATAAQDQVFPNLRSLDLSYNALTDACVDYIAHIMNSSINLCSIRLSRCILTCNFLQSREFQAAIKRLNSLHSVDFSRNNVGQTGLKCLLESINPESVKILNVSHTCKSTNNKNVCTYLSKYCDSNGCALNELDISGNMLSEDQIESLTSNMDGSNMCLNILNVSCNLTNVYFEKRISFLFFKCFTLLEKLSICNTKTAWVTKPTDMQ